MKRLAVIFIAVAALGLTAEAQRSKRTPEATEGDLAHATQQMAHKSPGHDHHMGPHMKLTELREPSPEDRQRGEELVKTAKSAIAKYKDPAAAEADGFRLFMPNIKKQRQYHYTNYRYAIEAAFRFDASRPTSLLYEDGENGKKKLIGVMYTAPARLAEEQLNERIPLSISQWHMHVNLCAPPKEQRDEMFKPNARFGLAGSIATEEECKAAGGTWRPRVFGWMVHMYPYEKTPDEIWSVARQTTNPLAAGSSEHKH
jgi:hypothetical protein